VEEVRIFIKYLWRNTVTLLRGDLIKRWHWRGMGVLVGILCLLLIGVSSYQAYRTRNVPAPLASSIELYAFDHGNLVGYSARDGSVRWKHPLEDSYTGRLSLEAEGNIIYVSGQTSTVNAVAAYRADTGTLLWRTPLAPFTSGLLTDQPPLVADGMVYVSQVDLEGQGYPFNDLLYALHGNSGQIAWKHQVPATPLAVDDGLIVALTKDHGIFAWHAHDGSLAWHSPLSGYRAVCAHQACYFLQDTVISPGTAQARDHFAALALRTSDGKLLWQRDIPLQGNASGADNVLAVFGQHVYVGVIAHWLDVLSTLDGALLWHREVGLPLGETPLEANGVVYTSVGLSIEALNAHDGTLLWHRDADPDSFFGTPLFIHNILFVAEAPAPLPARIPHGEGSSTLFALHAGDGSVYWHLPGGGPMAMTDTAA
jgi:outer membrane protein assembly factor BamB